MHRRALGALLRDFPRRREARDHHALCGERAPALWSGAVMPNATTPQARSWQNGVDLRLDLVQKLGPNFVNPVQSFIATNGPAKIGGLVKFSIFLNEGVEQVQVLRNTARDVASASVLQSYDAQNV